MQTRLLSTIFILFSAFILTSCEKELDDKPKTLDEPNYPIVGLWTGTYKVVQGEPQIDSLYYSFDIKSDSSFLVQGLGGDGNTYYGNAKWTLKGSAFTGTITTTNLSQTGVRQAVHATYDSTKNSLIGSVETIGWPFKAEFKLSRVN